MYLGVDVGGTKTLVAVMNNDGEIRERVKFPTPKHYDHFLLELRHTLAHFEHKDFKAAGVGMPVSVFDRRHQIGVSFSNLPWRKVPLQADIERIAHCPVVVENDAKMAGLSEAMLLKGKYTRVLYVTVSTGIGTALIIDQKIEPDVGDAGGGAFMLEHKGKFVSWESFASGRAIVERYGKRAEDIHDEKTWKAISRDLAPGLVQWIAIAEPEVIIIGGSVGTYFERYGKSLKEEVKRYDIPLLKLPAFKEAQRPEEAVVYGCYDLAKQRFAHSARVTS